jgi:hypothetical protein
MMSETFVLVFYEDDVATTGQYRDPKDAKLTVCQSSYTTFYRPSQCTVPDVRFFIGNVTPVPLGIPQPRVTRLN